MQSLAYQQITGDLEFAKSPNQHLSDTEAMNQILGWMRQDLRFWSSRNHAWPVYGAKR